MLVKYLNRWMYVYYSLFLDRIKSLIPPMVWWFANISSNHQMRVLT